ncbi:Putative ribokinase [Komagataella phaffii CBS 7435]|uniref:Ribokinase n=2 Tax=Komagataella phaffii TaxID=460519 RepID=C4R515_KOMPG|nr:Putative ribokinase [Komagataella phaffii GS115]AOA63773.1 GQ67_03680T0 [Komagataella phaffii]CAH2449580.1 Putative ribokinase [Komagataella phaffii CBS 7435]AOA69245.1 GQ68_03652T0 [Komagataella phaffii GS115]CAY70651.1 Putative ribokinase [Komagataella phaffii GS115]CCA39559.2 Putative ribokinase [Komagataella phaffii CBS 7435]
MSNSITIIGSLNYDMVTYTYVLPEAGQTVLSNHFECHYGGKGLNQAISAGKLLAPDSQTIVRMVGKIGNDSFGKELKQYLEDNRVSASHVSTEKDVCTGIATIIVEQESGENRILCTPGANGKLILTDNELETVFEDEKDRDYPGFVILQNEQPDPVSCISWIKSHRPNLIITYNPSPFNEEILLDKRIWSCVNVLVVNEGEALTCVKQLNSFSVSEIKDKINSNLVHGYTILAKELNRVLNPESGYSLVVITLGSQGSVYATDIESQYIPSLQVEPSKIVDTTGAGDTFLGALVVKLAQKEPIEEAIRFATAASSLTVQRRGAAESIPQYEDVISLLESH